MGVPKFVKMYVSDIKDVMTSDVVAPFSLCMDLNGFIHKVHGHVFGYGDQIDGTTIPAERKVEIRAKIRTPKGFEALKLEALNMIDIYLTELVIRKIKPTDILIICIDGIAPFAKGNQQRVRRQTSGLERTTYNIGVDMVPPEEKFDTAFLTGGHPFMKDVSDKVHKWIEANLNSLPKTIMFSDSSVPGEGEHKMFKILDEVREKIYIVDGTQTMKDKNEEFYKQRHMVYALDADVGILACRKLPYNFIWLREQYSLAPGARLPEAVDIPVMREHIIKTFSSEKALETRTRETDLRVINDFILLSFLIGDDFVPGMFTISFNIKFAINLFAEKYKEFTEEGYKFLSDEDGNINLDNYTEFLSMLESGEKALYEFRQRVNAEEVDLATAYTPEKFERVRALREANKIPVRDTERYYPAPILQYPYEQFVEVWKNILMRPVLIASNIPTSERINSILASTSSDAVTESEMDAICYNYLQMTQWNLKYYIGKENVNNSYYKYSLAPVIHQLNHFLAKGTFTFPNVVRINTDPFIGSTQMMVMLLNPHFSQKVLEGFFGKATEKKNDYQVATSNCRFLNTIHPRSFLFSLQGKYTSDNHQKIAFIPPIIYEDILLVQKHKSETYGTYFFTAHLGRGGVTFENPDGNAIWRKVLSSEPFVKSKIKVTTSIGFSKTNDFLTIPNRYDEQEGGDDGKSKTETEIPAPSSFIATKSTTADQPQRNISIAESIFANQRPPSKLFKGHRSGGRGFIPQNGTAAGRGVSNGSTGNGNQGRGYQGNGGRGSSGGRGYQGRGYQGNGGGRGSSGCGQQSNTMQVGRFAKMSDVMKSTNYM